MGLLVDEKFNMQMCLKHWEDLKGAIKARGLWDMVSDTGQEVMAKMKAGMDTPEKFDPLMGAHMLLVKNAIGCFGIGVMTVDENGQDRCPVCVAEAEPQITENWIEKAADGAAAYAKSIQNPPSR